MIHQLLFNLMFVIFVCPFLVCNKRMQIFGESVLCCLCFFPRYFLLILCFLWIRMREQQAERAKMQLEMEEMQKRVIKAEEERKVLAEQMMKLRRELLLSNWSTQKDLASRDHSGLCFFVPLSSSLLRCEAFSFISDGSLSDSALDSAVEALKRSRSRKAKDENGASRQYQAFFQEFSSLPASFSAFRPSPTLQSLSLNSAASASSFPSMPVAGTASIVDFMHDRPPATQPRPASASPAFSSPSVSSPFPSSVFSSSTMGSRSIAETASMDSFEAQRKHAHMNELFHQLQQTQTDVLFTGQSEESFLPVPPFPFPSETVGRSENGDLLLRCRRCGLIFNQNKNSQYSCAYHPGQLIRERWTCCGTLELRNGPPVYCSFTSHVP